MQVLFRETYWLRFWKLLQKEEAQQEVFAVCRALEVVAMDGDPMLDERVFDSSMCSL
jgi:hypothetical protein